MSRRVQSRHADEDDVVLSDSSLETFRVDPLTRHLSGKRGASADYRRVWAKRIAVAAVVVAAGMVAYKYRATISHTLSSLSQKAVRTGQDIHNALQTPNLPFDL
jgi:hypothetical protein